jgi:transcriptional regulator with XRE-family HTH domain
MFMKLEEANINETIARNIKIIRRLKGLTLKDMGEILNVTGQQVQKYEAGKNPISINKLLILANALGLSVTFFFEEFKF